MHSPIVPQQNQTHTIKHMVVIFLLYVLLTVIITFPLIFYWTDHYIDDNNTYDPAMGNSTATDPQLITWLLSWEAEILFENPRELFNAPAFYPNKLSLAFTEHSLGSAAFFIPFYYITDNPVLSYNIVIMLSFVLTAFAMYLFVFGLTRDKYISFLAGALFTFSIYRMSQISHIHIESIYFLPLTLLFVHKFFHSFSWKHIALAGGMFFFSALTSAHFIIMGGVAVGVLVLYQFITRKEVRINKRVWLLLATTGIGLLVALYPFYEPYMFLRGRGATRELEVIHLFSAWLVDFTWVSPILRRLFQVPVNLEHYLDMGMLFTALSIFAYLIYFTTIKKQWAKKEGTQRITHTVRVYSIIAMLAFLFSLGPHIHFNYNHILFPGPYYVLYNFVPGFDGLRALARFHMITQFALAVVVSIVFAKVFATVASAKVKQWTVALLSILIIVETMSGFTYPLRMFKVPHSSELPAVYTHLSQTDQEEIVLELPMFSLGEGVVDSRSEAYYLFNSIFHRQKLVNGYSGYFPDGYLALKYETDSFPNELTEVRDRGTTLIIVHFNDYDLSELREFKKSIDSSKNIEYQSHFDSDYIYRLVK